MTRLQPLQLENGAIVYIQTTDDTPQNPESSPEAPTEAPTEAPQELTRDSLGRDSKGLRQDLRQVKQAVQRAVAPVAPTEIKINDTAPAAPLKDTIRNYTDLVIGAFKDLSGAEIKTLKLEFGVELGGEAQVPYIANASAKSSLKVSVECTFPSRSDAANSRASSNINPDQPSASIAQ